MNAFFICGAQRSGTTLLSVLLSKHPDISLERRSIAFRIITCFKSLYDITPYNLDIDPSQFLTWLIENDKDGRLAQLVNPKNIEPEQSIVELIQKSINQKLKGEGKQIWGDKSPNLEHYYDDIRMLMPNAKVINIVRDGRAAAYSMSTRSSRNLQLSAQFWANGVTEALVNQQIVGKDNYKIIRFEDLIVDPENTMKSVCEFLGLRFVPAILNPDEKGLEEKEKYVKSTFDASKIDKWKSQLTAKEIFKLEKIQGPILQKFGYDLTTPQSEYRHKPLSTFRHTLYMQIDNFKTLFRSKRIGMVDRKKVKINVSLKSRVYLFLVVLTRELLSHPIFKSLFPQVYYRKKHFDEKEVSNNENNSI